MWLNCAQQHAACLLDVLCLAGGSGFLRFTPLRSFVAVGGLFGFRLLLPFRGFERGLEYLANIGGENKVHLIAQFFEAASVTIEGLAEPSLVRAPVRPRHYQPAAARRKMEEGRGS